MRGQDCYSVKYRTICDFKDGRRCAIFVDKIIFGGRGHLDIERIFYMPCFDKILFNLVFSEEM